MASNGKKKTTMAKIMRENKLRERRLDKQARKDERKREAAEGTSAPVAETTDVEEVTVGDEPVAAEASPR